MQHHDEREELAPRDIVARAIDFELKKNGEDFVYLDITHSPAEKTIEHFPLIHETLLNEYGLDITRDMIPVIPAMHYLCGGIMVDINGKTDINFLYAVGESASTGVHGGNRLASNSLLEGLVFANRAIKEIKKLVKDKAHKYKADSYAKIPSWNKDGVENLDEWILIKHERKEAQSIMWDYVGIVRSTARLKIALRRIDLIYENVKDFYHRTILSKRLLELRNQALVSQLIIRSALKRKESRGLHYSTDFPENRDPSRTDTVLLPRLQKVD